MKEVWRYRMAARVGRNFALSTLTTTQFKVDCQSNYVLGIALLYFPLCRVRLPTT